MAKKQSDWTYVLHPRAKKKDHVLTKINGEHIDLVGNGVEIISPARRNRIAKKIKYRKATEEDLKNYFEIAGEHSNQKIVIKVARETPPDSGSTTE